jgi:hypothetical protein
MGISFRRGGRLSFRIRGPKIGPVRSSLYLGSIGLDHKKKPAPYFYGKVTVNGREMRCCHHHRSLPAAVNCANTAERTGNYAYYS